MDITEVRLTFNILLFIVNITRVQYTMRGGRMLWPTLMTYRLRSLLLLLQTYPHPRIDTMND